MVLWEFLLENLDIGAPWHLLPTGVTHNKPNPFSFRELSIQLFLARHQLHTFVLPNHVKFTRFYWNNLFLNFCEARCFMVLHCKCFFDAVGVLVLFHIDCNLKMSIIDCNRITQEFLRSSPPALTSFKALSFSFFIT